MKAESLLKIHRLPLMLALVFPFIAQSSGRESSWRAGINYSVTEPVFDQGLSNREAAFDLTFQDNNAKAITKKIRLSYNGKEKTVQPDAKGKYVLRLIPGKYQFQFWYNDQFAEIFTDSIEAKPGHRRGITTYFRSAVNAVCYKPVIYLYPSNITVINVKLDLGHAFDFTYPQYSENGWTVTAHPDGNLQQGDKNFGYLFWEGPVDFEAKDLESNEGFVVRSTELTAFFEDKLALLGLNGKEIQDYITYWVPRLQAQPRHFIRFLVNEEFNRYAPMTITPQPDHLLRVFMLSRPMGENEEITCMEQTFPAFNRQGFTVVEWGGTVVEQKKL